MPICSLVILFSNHATGLFMPDSRITPMESKFHLSTFLLISLSPLSLRVLLFLSFQIAFTISVLNKIGLSIFPLVSPELKAPGWNPLLSCTNPVRYDYQLPSRVFYSLNPLCLQPRGVESKVHLRNNQRMSALLFRPL